MNPDHFDPKSHIPPVHAGDDWGDLDRVSEIPQVGLPPRRPDRGIPTKRELNPVTAKRHAPYPKLCDDDETLAAETISMGAKETAKPATKAARKASKKVAKKAPKAATKRSARKKAADKSGSSVDDAPQGIDDATAPTSEPGSYAYEKGVPLPVTVERGSKRFRVNEIAPQLPVENRTQKRPLVIGKTTGIRPSNDALMQNGNLQTSDAISPGQTNLRTTLAWTICSGAVVVLVVVVAILLSRPPKGGPEVKKLSDFQEFNPEASEVASEPKEGQSIDELINGEGLVKGIFTKYVTSKSVDDFIGLIYSPDKNRSLVSNKWEPMGVGPGWRPGENCAWTVTENEGVQFGILTGVLPDFTGFRAVFRKEGDALKLDWRATTGHSSAVYAELKQGQGDASEIRAILSPGDFHTFTLPEGEFRCYRLTAPDREDNIWAYTKINGAIDVQLASQFVPSQLTGEVLTEMPVVLELTRGPAQSLPNQWMISNVVRMNWLDE